MTGVSRIIPHGTPTLPGGPTPVGPPESGIQAPVQATGKGAPRDDEGWRS